MQSTVLMDSLASDINNLPHLYKTVLSLCYVEGLSLHEISLVLGLTPAEAYLTYLRAISALPGYALPN